ncbi:hypothetical protein ACEPAG_6861 [Sanghuangporus baumii]
MAVAANPKELGVLVVVVLKARNLPDKHTFSKQDPYAVIQLGPFKEQTQIDKRGGQHPVWDEDLHLKVLSQETKENRTLKVSSYAKEPKGDELIGVGEVDIKETLKTGEFDDWVKLEIDGTYRGEVYLELTFFAAGPPSLTRRPSKMAPSERLWRPPQTPPKTSPYNSPPSRHAAELGVSASMFTSASTRPSHLAPPRESRSQSPSSRSEPPLPPSKDEVPAALKPAPLRASAGKIGSAGTSPKTDPVPIPAALRPGGTGAQRQQHPSSLPSSPAHANYHFPSSGTGPGVAYGSQPSNGLAAPPGQPAYTSPLDDHVIRPPISPPPPPTMTSPRNDYATLPPVDHTRQRTYSTSYPGSGDQQAAHLPSSAPSQPIYPPAYPPVSPLVHSHLSSHPPSSAPNHPQTTYAPHHQSTYSPYPPVSSGSAPYPPINPSYDPPPLSAYTSSPPPSTSPAVPVQSAGSLHLSFPEPSISPAPPSGGYPPMMHPTTASELLPGETEEERQRRLETRYSSPMPLPPDASPPPPPPKPAQSPPAKSASPSPKLSQKHDLPQSQHHHHQTVSEASTSSAKHTPLASTEPRPSPSRVPESYLERERLALERLRQEEADAELARRLAAEAEAEAEAETRTRAEREKTLAEEKAEERRRKERVEMKRPAQARVPTVEETDEELARRLARELNSDVLEEVRRHSSRDGSAGRSSNGSPMPGGW